MAHTAVSSFIGRQRPFPGTSRKRRPPRSPRSAYISRQLSARRTASRRCPPATPWHHLGQVQQSPRRSLPRRRTAPACQEEGRRRGPCSPPRPTVGEDDLQRSNFVARASNEKPTPKSHPPQGRERSSPRRSAPGAH